MYDNNATTCVLNIAKNYKQDLEFIDKAMRAYLYAQMEKDELPTVEVVQGYTSYAGYLRRRIDELDKILTVYSQHLPF